MRRKRSFAPELEEQATRLLEESDPTMAQLCQTMGLSETSLQLLIYQLCTERGGITPVASQVLLGHPGLSPEQLRIEQLEAKLRKVERERNILKEFTAFLMLEPSQRAKAS